VSDSGRIIVECKHGMQRSLCPWCKANDMSEIIRKVVKKLADREFEPWIQEIIDELEKALP
jgi:hypothetical protein